MFFYQVSCGASLAQLVERVTLSSLLVSRPYAPPNQSMAQSLSSLIDYRRYGRQMVLEGFGLEGKKV